MIHNATDGQLTNSQELGLNLWHSYVHDDVINGKHYPRGWFGIADNDKLFTDIVNYINPVTGRMDNAGSHGKVI